MATFRDLEPELMAGHSISRREWHGTVVISYSKQKNILIREAIDPDTGIHRSSHWFSNQAEKDANDWFIVKAPLK